MCYRSTPITATGPSPAQLMTGRQIRTTVPVFEKALLPCPVDEDLVNQRGTAAKEHYRFFYNRRHSVRPLPELRPGVRVKLDGDKGWTTPAKLVGKSMEPRSYLVEKDNGTVTRCNRQHLQAVPESVDPAEQQQHASPDPPQQDCSFLTTAAVTPQMLSPSKSSAGPTLGSPLQSETPQRVT